MNAVQTAARFVGLSALVAANVLAGCAQQPVRPDPLVQCQASLTSCDAQRKQCVAGVDRLSRELSARTDQLEKSETQLGKSREQLAQCESQTVKADDKVASLSAAKRELEQRLTDSIAQKDVQIDLLNNQLSVRVLDRILFASGSAVIGEKGRQVLGQVAQVLVDGSEHIRVEGHTDNVPISQALRFRYPTNWELSAARAISVVRLFQEDFEIEPVRLEAVGHAFYQPVAGNDTEEERQRNRRVEVVLTAARPQ